VVSAACVEAQDPCQCTRGDLIERGLGDAAGERRVLAEISEQQQGGRGIQPLRGRTVPETDKPDAEDGAWQNQQKQGEEIHCPREA